MCSIEENFSLKNHNTFGINAKAKYFVKFTKQLLALIDLIKEHGDWVEQKIIN